MERRRFKLVKETAEAAIDLCNDYERAWTEVDKYRLKAAKWKANFFHKTELANKIQRQIEVNLESVLYKSGRYMNLEDMCLYEIIAKEEYDFCNE